MPTAFHEGTKSTKPTKVGLYKRFFVPFVFLRDFVMSRR